MEENMVNEFADVAAEESLNKVVDLVPTDGMDVKTVGIVAGASFVAGVVVSKVAKPIARKIKSIWINRKKKVDKDDFKVVEDVEATEVPDEESKAN
jgi:hypothetical protein